MAKQINDIHEFKPLLVEIEERPLNPLGRAIFWIIICALVFTLLWTLIGKVDVVASAQGKVIPSGEVKVIQPLNTGVVRTIHVAAGDHVEQGQVLLEIDPSDVDPQLISYRADLQQVDLEICRIDAQLNQQPFMPPQGYPQDSVLIQQQIYLAQKQSLAEQIEAKEKVLLQLDEQQQGLSSTMAHADYMITVLRERLKRFDEVREILSRDDYEQTASELRQYQSQYETERHEQGQIAARKEQTLKEIAYLKEEFRNQLLAELAEKQQRKIYLTAQIEQTEFRSHRQQITAPVTGYVSRLLFHTIGGVVTPAEKLAYIVPDDSPLLIKASLLNKDAGFVASGMDATIKVETFNFQKYGTIAGKVTQVSKDSIEDERLGLVYEVYIQPEQTTLLVDGKETPITAGMSVAAEVKVGKRRIIEFFIYPLIKYLDEGMSVR